MNVGDVAILDCGAQYAKVIDRRVRELGVASDIIPVDTAASQLVKYKAFIITGGPRGVYEPGAPQCDPKLFTLGKPILGICYGMQLIAHGFGGSFGQQPTKEYGETHIRIEPRSRLFAGLDNKQQVLMSHGDSLTQPPAGFTVIARSGDLIAGIERDDIIGVQFHPEVDLTLHGKEMLRNFLFDVARLQRTHTLDEGIERAVQEIRQAVGKNNVAVLISGGVDSAVTAALLLRALDKEQVYAIHIDHGFMRKNESKDVMDALTALGLKHLDLVEAQETFAQSTTIVDGKESKPLNKTSDPEEKRKIIGDAFMTLADRELEKIPGKVFLAQGTLRPDLIESASELVSTTAETIKTHHNDSRLVREKRREGLIIETNKNWHKDEVRQIARKLGLPETIASRQPFPGPGLAVRVLCTQHGTPVPERVHRNVALLAAEYGLTGTVLPVQSVGVQGDGRTYTHTVVLSGDAPWETLKEAALEIPRTVHGVNRVCYLLRGNVHNPVVVPTHLTPDVLTTLREADAIANTVTKEHDVSLAQLPVVLLPISLGGGRTIVLRPFVTNDFMTGRAAVIGTEIPHPCVDEMVERIATIDGIGAVLYDLTSKPPGTTEWE